MIDLKKTYRTRDGRAVRIYALNGGWEYPVHGAVEEGPGWTPASWTADGRFDRGFESCRDLIEVKQRIRRTVWVNVYKSDCDILPSRRDADSLMSCPPRLACVKVEIDCDEGEGL